MNCRIRIKICKYNRCSKSETLTQNRVNGTKLLNKWVYWKSGSEGFTISLNCFTSCLLFLTCSHSLLLTSYLLPLSSFLLPLSSFLFPLSFYSSIRIFCPLSSIILRFLDDEKIQILHRNSAHITPGKNNYYEKITIL